MNERRPIVARIVPSHVAGLALGAMGLAFCIGAFKLGFWTDDGPGAGLLPLVVGALLFPLLLVSMSEPVMESETPFEIKPLIAIGLTLLYALVVSHVGFVPATLLMLIAWIRGLYGQSWIRAVSASVCLTAFGLLIFVVLLKVPVKLFPDLP